MMAFLIRISTFLVLAVLGAAQAHTILTTLFVDGVNQGDGVCIRMNSDPAKATYPVRPVTSKDIACGINGETAVAGVCPVKASSTLTFQFREWPDASKPGSIDVGHKGPCAVYMKKVDSAIMSDNAAGEGWFKVWEAGYDEGAGKWCTTKMIENNGHISVKIPEDIEGGYYLVRTELLALHAAHDNPPDPQFYVNCAQIFVQSTGTVKPPAVYIGENFYDLGIPGLDHDIYKEPAEPWFPLGPPVYVPSSWPKTVRRITREESEQRQPMPPLFPPPDPPRPMWPRAEAGDLQKRGEQINQDESFFPWPPAPSKQDRVAPIGPHKRGEERQPMPPLFPPPDPPRPMWPRAEAGCESIPVPNGPPCRSNCPHRHSKCTEIEKRENTIVQTEGLKPEGCIMVNANWCGLELPPYNDEATCWGAAQNCWKQNDACYKSAPPTGSANCNIWANMCSNLNDLCHRGDYHTSPYSGKDLTPEFPPLTEKMDVFDRSVPRLKDTLKRLQMKAKV